MSRVLGYSLFDMENKNTKIKDLFGKIKKAHDVYVRCSNEKKIALLDAYGVVFDELVQLGVPKAFSESLLIFGKEFVDSFKPDLSPSPVTLPTNPIEPSRPATVEDAEAIFGVKAVDMTEKEKREAALATKSGVLAWQSLPAKGDHVKIQPLIKQTRLPLDK
jgi:hypothetical protein